MVAEIELSIARKSFLHQLCLPNCLYQRLYVESYVETVRRTTSFERLLNALARFDQHCFTADAHLFSPLTDEGQTCVLSTPLILPSRRSMYVPCRLPRIIEHGANFHSTTSKHKRPFFFHPPCTLKASRISAHTCVHAKVRRSQRVSSFPSIPNPPISKDTYTNRATGAI